MTIQTLRRLPIYLNYLKTLPSLGIEYISATAIGQSLELNDVQVRKDLACISSEGRPKVGYPVLKLINDIEKYLGYQNADSAIVVGAGNLGKALMSYKCFEQYGLKIEAAFDCDKSLWGKSVQGKLIFPMDKMRDLCNRMKINIGIITVNKESAQEVCNQLIDCGIQAIWNFAPVHLKVPDNIIVQNENMDVSLSILSKHLSEKC